MCEVPFFFELLGRNRADTDGVGSQFSTGSQALGVQQSSSLKSYDAVQDDPMRRNNGADGAACFLRLAGPQVM